MKLFCKHKYEPISRDLSGVWKILECSNCGKLRKGGFPKMTMNVPPPPFGNNEGWEEIRELRKKHPVHERRLVKTTQHYECSGCDEKTALDNHPSYVDKNKIDYTNMDV